MNNVFHLPNNTLKIIDFYRCESCEEELSFYFNLDLPSPRTFTPQTFTIDPPFRTFSSGACKIVWKGEKFL